MKVTPPAAALKTLNFKTDFKLYTLNFKLKEEMKWFNEKEFACRCCGELPPFARENIEALVREVLDPAREKLGMPIVVNSGYRCPKHNREVGGVARSQHLVGEAADIAPVESGELKVDSQLKKLVRLIVERGKFDQLILYPGFIHVSWKRPSTGSGTNRKRVLRKTDTGYTTVLIADLIPSSRAETRDLKEIPGQARNEGLCGMREREKEVRHDEH